MRGIATSNVARGTIFIASEVTCNKLVVMTDDKVVVPARVSIQGSQHICLLPFRPLQCIHIENLSTGSQRYNIAQILHSRTCGVVRWFHTNIYPVHLAQAIAASLRGAPRHLQPESKPCWSIYPGIYPGDRPIYPGIYLSG